MLVQRRKHTSENKIGVKVKSVHRRAYLLLEDNDGTTFSQPKSLGVAVTSKSEAMKYAQSGGNCERTYEEVIVFDDFKDAIDYSYGKNL
jgi:hypothetical protein